MPFRASRSTRSGRPGAQPDQDIFDGLPVRQWCQSGIVIGADDDNQTSADPAPNQLAELASEGIPELPMPKGSDQYAPWVQKLLRLARAGKAYTRPQENGSTKHEGDKNNVSHAVGDADDKDDDNSPRGQKRNASHAFVATRWMQIPKHQEEPDRELLAKRRKGLAPIHAMATTTGNEPMRKAKVKRADAEGQATVFEVMIPQGQTVEGEIREEITLENAGAPIAAPKPGTVVEGLGVVNDDGVVMATEGITPIKRKGPDPAKRKKKSKKGLKIWQKRLAETHGMGVSASVEDLEARRKERAERIATGDAKEDEDVEMGEGHDDGEEDESSEDGEEDREDGELSPSPGLEPSPPKIPTITKLSGENRRASPPNGAASSDGAILPNGTYDTTIKQHHVIDGPTDSAMDDGNENLSPVVSLLVEEEVQDELTERAILATEPTDEVIAEYHDLKEVPAPEAVKKPLLAENQTVVEDKFQEDIHIPEASPTTKEKESAVTEPEPEGDIADIEFEDATQSKPHIQIPSQDLMPDVTVANLGAQAAAVKETFPVPIAEAPLVTTTADEPVPGDKVIVAAEQVPLSESLLAQSMPIPDADALPAQPSAPQAEPSQDSIESTYHTRTSPPSPEPESKVQVTTTSPAPIYGVLSSTTPPPVPIPSHAELPVPSLSAPEEKVLPSTEPSSVSPSANAALPISPASPQRPETEALTPTPEPKTGDVHFEDGEVDLLGTVSREEEGRGGDL